MTYSLVDPVLNSLLVGGLTVDLTPLAAVEIITDPIPLLFPGADVRRTADAFELQVSIVGAALGGVNDLDCRLYHVPITSNDDKANWADLRDTVPFSVETLDLGAGTAQGSDLVTNGDFATDTVWEKGPGWLIGSGVASHVGSGPNGGISQQITLTVGDYYLLQTAGAALIPPATVTVSHGSHFLGSLSLRTLFKAENAAADLNIFAQGSVTGLDDIALTQQTVFNFTTSRFVVNTNLSSGLAVGFLPSVDFTNDTFISARLRRFVGG